MIQKMSPKSCLSKIRFDQITGECVLWFDFQQVHTSPHLSLLPHFPQSLDLVGSLLGLRKLLVGTPTPRPQGGKEEIQPLETGKAVLN